METPIIEVKFIDNVAKIELISSYKIYYTLDNTEPSKDSILYTEPLDYPTNTILKCIAFNEETQEVSDIIMYDCKVPYDIYMGNFLRMCEQICLKTDLDMLHDNFSSVKAKILDLTYGSIINNGSAFYLKNGYIIPFGSDFDVIMPNADALLFERLPKNIKKGQILQKNGWLKITDGSNWHDFQQIYSGTFANKPTVEQGIPIGFAYFCTDKQTTEGMTNGIMIYHKGNNVWVDALGRVVQ